MILLTNGCSWTYGGGLDLHNPPREELDQVTWPKHLADLLGASNFCNLADGCGSNQRIIRTTLDWVMSQSREILEDTVAVIQWTEESRYEYYVPIDFNNEYENIEEQWAKVKTGVINPLKFDYMYNISQDRIKYHNSSIQNVYTYISNCEALSGLFTRLGIKYYFWDFTDYPERLPLIYKNYLLENFNWLQHNENSFAKWDFWKYDRLDVDPHPSLEGHKQLAHVIYSSIRAIDNDH